MPIRALYPGQLPTWRFESTKPETQAKRERQTKRVKELANIRQRKFRARIISNHDAENAKAMEEMEELTGYRYFGFHDFANFIRFEELHHDFWGTLEKESNWLTPLVNPKDIYSLFYDATHDLARNIILCFMRDCSARFQIIHHHQSYRSKTGDLVYSRNCVCTI